MTATSLKPAATLEHCEVHERPAVGEVYHIEASVHDENTAYVVAPAQTGIHYGRRQSHGHAMVIDPWGTVLSDAGKTEGAAIAPADKSRVKKIREQMPSLKHRKVSLFAN